MKTEQINIRLEGDLVGALERVAREEALDRAQAIRRLLEAAIRQWEVDRAVLGYQRGALSLGRAAEEAGLTQWELLDVVRTAGVAYPLGREEVERRFEQLSGEGGRAEPATLPDIPPKPRRVLLVGINPAPMSVGAGHYYQGRIGQRLWRRLERVGLLADPVPGAEDEAFAAAGHGLTDLVKRPTPSSADLGNEEFAAGIEKLRKKIQDWKPGLVLFAFKEPARRLLGPRVSPGLGPQLEGVPTFLLSGPYAPREAAERIDAELIEFLRSRLPDTSRDSPAEHTQRITANDIERGQIRLPRPAKRFLPPVRADVEVVLRGKRFSAPYDPRTGADRERSGVLRLGRAALEELVTRGERLRVTRGLGGVLRLE